MQGFLSVSERLHSGLILLAELAAAPTEAQSLRLIAERMHVSEGYLEEIAASLRKQGIITGKRGATGGYVLAVPPESLSLQAVIEAIEGPIALVPCQGSSCVVASHCRTKHLWGTVQRRLLSTLADLTLRDVLNT